MAPRAYWKGYLKLSLVSCPIALSPAASSSERISFRQINKKTGNRLRQQLVDEETREPVAPEDKGRGYEVDKGVFIEVDDDELEAIQVESRHTIDIDSFVPADEIDKRYLDHPYYIVPDGKAGVDAFAVIRDAMKDQERVALARIVCENVPSIQVDWSLYGPKLAQVALTVGVDDVGGHRLVDRGALVDELLELALDGDVVDRDAGGLR